jgi:NADH oxidase (H2O2-forming)
MKVVVIGNGIAGYTVAETLRLLDGQCGITMVSSEPYPIYSNCVLPNYISGEIPRRQVFIKARKDYQDLKIQTIFGRQAKEIDPTEKKLILANGKALSFDRLVIATGSEAIFPGDGKKGIFKLKTLADAEKIRRHKGKRAVVIGGGAIGIETGIALRYQGYKVTIIEMLKQILPLGLDQKGADKVKEILEREGIEVSNEERAQKIIGEERIKGLITNKRELECDTLIWSVGMRPRVELAKQAGIDLGEKGGIRVNARMETNIKDIFACGDCVETSDILSGEYALNLFWLNAHRQGKVAARNCLGLDSKYPGSQNFLNLNIFGNQVVGFGFTESALHQLKNIKKLKEEISLVEKERKGSYYRLVFLGDKCMGGQFININSLNYSLGLLWPIN